MVVARDGTEYAVIRDGRLTALDDQEVRTLAARYGDPDELLKEDWIPQISGITCPGSYDAYAKDPASWIYKATPYSRARFNTLLAGRSGKTGERGRALSRGSAENLAVAARPVPTNRPKPT